MVSVHRYTFKTQNGTSYLVEAEVRLFRHDPKWFILQGKKRTNFTHVLGGEKFDYVTASYLVDPNKFIGCKLHPDGDRYHQPITDTIVEVLKVE